MLASDLGASRGDHRGWGPMALKTGATEELKFRRIRLTFQDHSGSCVGSGLEPARQPETDKPAGERGRGREASRGAECVCTCACSCLRRLV